LRWRLPKMLFIINRYIISSLFFVQGVPQFLYPLSISFCRSSTVLALWIPLFNLCIAELLAITRVCSLYDNHKPLIWSLRGLLFAALIGAMVPAISIVHNYHTFLAYEFLPGCWNSAVRLACQALWAIFLPSTVFVCFSRLTRYGHTATHQREIIIPQYSPPGAFKIGSLESPYLPVTRLCTLPSF